MSHDTRSNVNSAITLRPRWYVQPGVQRRGALAAATNDAPRARHLKSEPSAAPARQPVATTIAPATTRTHILPYALCTSEMGDMYELVVPRDSLAAVHSTSADHSAAHTVQPSHPHPHRLSLWDGAHGPAHMNLASLLPCNTPSFAVRSMYTSTFHHTHHDHMTSVSVVGEIRTA